MQYDLFGTQNKLQGVRVCLNGLFGIDSKALNKMLKEAGVEVIDRVSTSREYKEGETIPPAKEGTNIYVIGENPNEESIKRYEMNVHDGFKALKINEAQLMELIAGTSDLEVPKTVEKRLDLTIDCIRWQAPTINDKVFVSRASSPLKYDLEGSENRIYMKDLRAGFPRREHDVVPANHWKSGWLRQQSVLRRHGHCDAQQRYRAQA